MTRDKEIQKAAKEIAQDIEDWEIAEDIEDAFMEGALWADRTMIEDACEWLEYVFKELEISGIDDWVDCFKNAMKGGEE